MSKEKLEILIWDVWIHCPDNGFTRFGSMTDDELAKVSETLLLTRMGTAQIWR